MPRDVLLCGPGAPARAGPPPGGGCGSGAGSHRGAGIQTGGRHTGRKSAVPAEINFIFVLPTRPTWREPGPGCRLQTGALFAAPGGRRCRCSEVTLTIINHAWRRSTCRPSQIRYFCGVLSGLCVRVLRLVCTLFLATELATSPAMVELQGRLHRLSSSH